LKIKVIELINVSKNNILFRIYVIATANASPSNEVCSKFR